MNYSINGSFQAPTDTLSSSLDATSLDATVSALTDSQISAYDHHASLQFDHNQTNVISLRSRYYLVSK